MLLLNNKPLDECEEKDLETASENLPSEFDIIGLIENPNYEYGYDFLLIGKDENADVKYEDIIYSFSGNKQKYSEELDFMEQNFMDGYRFILDKIPDYIQSIDLLFTKRQFHIVSKTTSEFEIKFSSKYNDCLFSYGFKKELNDTKNFLCGTVARVSDGWKFYPNFKEFSASKQTIMDRYREGLW